VWLFAYVVVAVKPDHVEPGPLGRQRDENGKVIQATLMVKNLP
jgi:hypothetical protein